MRFKSVNIFRIIRLGFGSSNSYIKTEVIFEKNKQIKQTMLISWGSIIIFSRYSHQFLIPKLDEKASSLNHENISFKMTACGFVSLSKKTIKDRHLTCKWNQFQSRLKRQNKMKFIKIIFLFTLVIVAINGKIWNYIGIVSRVHSRFIL